MNAGKIDNILLAENKQKIPVEDGEVHIIFHNVSYFHAQICNKITVASADTSDHMAGEQEVNMYSPIFT